MDIKDFILIGGGLLIASVVAHGFWIAWRDRRQELRIDIKPDLIPDEPDDIDRLRGELPNGGSRPVSDYPVDPQQDLLDLDAPPPLELQPPEAPPVAPARRIEPALTVPEADAAAGDPRDQRLGEGLVDDRRFRDEGRADRPGAGAPEPAMQEPQHRSDRRPRVAEVALPDPLSAEEPRRPRRLGQRRPPEPDVQEPAAAPLPPVEELIVVNVLAEADAPFTGDELFTVLRSCGLKFGDMNIFHRVEPLTKAVQYSVASAVEPGTFDMADMEAIRCPGLCLFMQLPGPEDPAAAFEDMLSVARSLIRSLGGEVKDEHRNVMTPQTVEHYRQRIVDFSRRRMSKRA